VENGLTELEWNQQIAEVARNHSQDMAERNYFSHESPEGYDFTWRYAEGNVICAIQLGDMIYGGAENIHKGGVYGTIHYTNGIETSRDYKTLEEIAQDVATGWMNSPGHRANILTPYWQTEGLGVAVTSDGAVYSTENFC